MAPVKVKLGDLAARALSAAGDTDPDRVSLLLPRAVRFYLDDRDGERPSRRYPPFLPVEDGAAEKREVGLDEELWQELEVEAESQEVEPEVLVQHAAFYYGAARDEGRLTERIAEELRREESGAG